MKTNGHDECRQTSQVYGRLRGARLARVPQSASLAAVLLVAASLLPAQDLTIARLFSRPYLWGTWPSQLAWARNAHQLGFLWNAAGGSFRDLYVYNADTKKLTRLTDLKGLKDPINDTPAEEDIHRKNYLPPPSGLSGFELSDDGTQAVFSYRGDLFLVPTSGAPFHRLTKTKTAEVNPQFSPDAKRIAYEESGQLYVMDLDGGFRAQKTDIKPPASLGGFEWSPNGKDLSYVVRPSRGRTMPLPIYSGQFVTASPFPRSVAGDQPDEGQLFVIESTGDNPARPLDIGHHAIPVRAPQWSPDSKSLIVITQAPNFKSQDIHVVDTIDNKSKVVFHQTDDRWIEIADAGWDQQSQRLWFTSDQTGYQHLYVVNKDGSQLRQLTKGDWEVHNDTFSHHPQWIGNDIYFSSTEKSPAERQFYRLNVDSDATPEQLSHREGLNIGWVSEDGKEQAFLEADSKNPLDLYVEGQQITKSPLPEFYQLPWAETKYLTYQSRADHKPVSARLLLPPNFDATKSYPAVIYIHGSGYATSVLKQWGSYQDLRYAFNCYLTSRGYVILEMDYRGSTGYGRDWRSGVYLNMGGPDLDDVLGGVDYLRSMKNIDMHKIGIWGWSYGGFMTAAAMFKAPDVFKAGAAFSGVYDWNNYNAGYTDERLTTPAENPEAYRRSSPINFSNQLQGHLLILHGIADNNVLFQDAVQLSEKLIQENKQFEESFYPEESHAYLRDDSLQNAFGRAAALFDRYLKP
jgi:dipeptidyl aminopeptidase/acylaminoacyl peptidase